MAEYRVSGGVRGAIWAAGILTLIGLAVGDVSFGIVIALIVYGLVAFVMSAVPLRYSMNGLLFLVLVLPNPAEGLPTSTKIFVPPFASLGGVLLNHLNVIDRSSGLLSLLPLNGVDFLFVTLGLVVVQRRMTGSKIDRRNGYVPTPKPMLQLACIALSTAVFTEMHGLARGGDFAMSLWQLNAVMYLPLVFLLYQESIRGPVDFPGIAKTVLGGVIYKSLLAMYVHTFIRVPADPITGSTKPVFATSHADSVFFSCSLVIILVLLLERVGGKRTKWWAAFFVPLIMGAVQANNRRLAWAQIGLSCVAIFVISRPSKLKKQITRAALLGTPLALIYVIAGWNSQYGAAFKPVRIIRSIADAKSDGSSLWREFENVNIIATFKNNPVFGTGYGHPYEEIIVLPAVDYPLEPYIPHNSLLGVWCYTGVVGFTGLTLLWAVGVYFAVRAYRHSSDKTVRAASLIAYCAVFIYLMQAWGDIGLGNWVGVFTMAVALTVASKAAAAAGQWGAKPKPPRAAVDAPHAAGPVPS